MNEAIAAARRPLRVLLVEDTADDAVLLMRTLAKGGFAPEHIRVDTAKAMREALDAGAWDIVISDYSLPEFSAFQALEMTKRHDPDLPFIIVSGNIGEDVAVGAMRAGAQDYLLKHNLKRLAPAVARELDEAASRRNRLAAEQALREQRHRLDSILNALGDIVWSVSLPDLRVAHLNPAAEFILGHPLDSLKRGLKFWHRKVIHPGDRDRMRGYLRNTLRSGANSAEYRIVRPDGTIRWLFDRSRVIMDEQGRPMRIDGVASDVTRHKESQALLYRAAHHDALTGLPNRKLMQERLRQGLARHDREGGTLALMLIDIDRFKTINDSLGHKAGDSMLCQVAERLAGSLREEDTVARLGGDEFVVVLPDVADEAGAAAVVHKLTAALVPPMKVDGRTIHCTASFGIALSPRDGEDVESLLKNADTAMYAAKRGGRNAHRFYAAEMNAAAARLLDLENALRGALERREFEVYYQPQVDLARDGAVCGFEALLRWRHPERGLIPPAEFIPLAEETGLIVPIGEWVLGEACRQARTWIERFDPDLRVAVNLSARQFARPGLAQTVAATLAACGLTARNLELELTESMIMDDPDQSGRILAELKAMGITLAVDDFGTGYSSLAYLRRFPIDVLKIDQSFVSDLVSNPDDAAICASIIAMAHSLRLKVVAEGVENDGQLGFLAQRGCDHAQGYLIGRPLPSVDATTLLGKGGTSIRHVRAADAGMRTLLLVDDDAYIRAALQRLLRPDGYRILAARDAAEAFDLLAANRVGVIVADQRMPGMSGAEFLGHVKELHPDVVRIMLSGGTDPQSVIESINAGAVYRYVTKPWDDEQLRAIVREAFGREALQRENTQLSLQYRNACARLAELEAALQGDAERPSRPRGKTKVSLARTAP
ncbi:MAG: EAL domain-containing protein [Denitratisoma sp.]|nr:EAL domain-containing protein [Denitratisoma sp.]